MFSFETWLIIGFMNKNRAREKGLKNRSLLSAELREKKSRDIFIQVLNKIHDAKTVGCYVSMKDEVSTDEILHYCFTMRIPICVPKVEKGSLSFYEIQSRDDLGPGIFGTREPVSGRKVRISDIDVMLVPLSSYDQNNNRTGYGKGYYDSILNECSCKIGLGFNEQEVDSIETDPWDVKLDEVIHA